ncbi:universal stress protein [Pseudoduganella danionis]|uniref:universal stress protein n=1 Tax=Pseudoduganella danionis TaxID=1890295 RepID=UPI0035B3E986
MSYKTILVQADLPDTVANGVRLASQLANDNEAHLVGFALSGADQAIAQCNAAVAGMVALPTDMSALTEKADALLAGFAKQAQGNGVSSFETRRIDDTPDYAIVMQARYADLLVMPQGDASGTPSAVLQYVMLHGGKPVLIVPTDTKVEQFGKAPLLAWDGGQQAARAINAALPLLKRAGKATLAVFNGTEHYAAHGQQPGADMATYLARQGVQVEVVQKTTKQPIGTALLELAAELKADLLVMGGYGHSRLREIALGGATRDVLKHMNLPVLMTH